MSRAAEVLDARGRRMLLERAAASLLLSAGTLAMPGGADLAVPVLVLGLGSGLVAALAHRWVGPLNGRVLAWGSLVLDIVLATAFVHVTGGVSSPGFSLYLFAFLTPLALNEPAAMVAAGPAAAVAFLLTALLRGEAAATGQVLLRLAILGAASMAAVRVQVERRALVVEHHRRVQELSAINSVARELSAILDPDALLWRAVGLVRDRFGHLQVRLGLLAGDRLLVRSAEASSVESWPVDAPGLLAEAARTGATAVAPGGRHGPEGAAVPLVAGGRLRGALEVSTRRVGVPRGCPIGDRDVRSLEAVAALIAVALESAELHQSALRSALTDPLTGLFNVRYLQETLGGALERAVAARRPFSLLMLDVDNLREINNRCGHVAGDGALREVARVVAAATRGGDVAARYGGDEFLVALPDAAPEVAAAVAERIRDGVEGIHLEHRGAHVPLTVSIGVASQPGDGSTLDALVEAADRAAYRAKARGRNRIALLSPAEADVRPAEPLRSPAPLVPTRQPDPR